MAIFAARCGRFRTALATATGAFTTAETVTDTTRRTGARPTSAGPERTIAHKRVPSIIILLLPPGRRLVSKLSLSFFSETQAVSFYAELVASFSKTSSDEDSCYKRFLAVGAFAWKARRPIVRKPGSVHLSVVVWTFTFYRAGRRLGSSQSSSSPPKQSPPVVRAAVGRLRGGLL